MSTRAYIRYPYPEEPGRVVLEIKRNPPEYIGDEAPFNDLQFFRSLDTRIFAAVFPAPDEARVYELVPVEVYHQD
jgi:hypothetical protein